MAHNGHKSAELKQLLHVVIDTAGLMIRLVTELGGPSPDPAADESVYRVDAAVRDVILPILMEQESELERLLEMMNPEAYMEWLLSVPSQAKIFAVRRQRFQDCRAMMA